MKNILTITVRLLLILIISFCTGCEKNDPPSPVREIPAKPEQGTNKNPTAPAPAPSDIIKPKVINGGTFKVGYMYWARSPLLLKDWSVVLSGTVSEIYRHQLKGDQINPEGTMAGVVKIHEIYSRRSTQKVDFQNASFFKSSGGFDGLKKGDKIIVFIDSYDGGYGVVPVSDTHCHLGLKITGFDDPVIDATKMWLSKKGDFFEQGKLAVDEKFAKVWRKYDKVGLEAFLERYNTMLEMDKK